MPDPNEETLYHLTADAITLFLEQMKDKTVEFTSNDLYQSRRCFMLILDFLKNQQVISDYDSRRLNELLWEKHEIERAIALLYDALPFVQPNKWTPLQAPWTLQSWYQKTPNHLLLLCITQTMPDLYDARIKAFPDPEMPLDDAMQHMRSKLHRSACLVGSSNTIDETLRFAKNFMAVT